MQLIYIENQTSAGTLRPTELNKLVEALQHQTKDFNTSPWVEHGYCHPIEIRNLNSGEKLPAGAWNLILLDSISVAGALGFHEDENNNKVPVSYVGIKECREDDVSIIEVASHEMLEMTADPFVNSEDTIRTVSHEGKEWIVEICDPVQGTPYRAPNGEDLANYVWPKWFGMDQTRSSIAHDDMFIKPFQLSLEGYISTRNNKNEEWQQVFGEKRKELPPWADRLLRVNK